MNVAQIYAGSNGELTRALYDALADKPNGQIAINLFRACKCSGRAKVYRGGRFKGAAYERKNWSLSNLCQALKLSALTWGWKLDPAEEYHRWVLYVELPTGQVSFHAAAPLSPERYAGEWDRSNNSAGRIIRYVESVLKSDETACAECSDACACIGRGKNDGCGFLGGKSGGVCPDCGGMLLSKASLIDAAYAAQDGKCPMCDNPIKERADRLDARGRIWCRPCQDAFDAIDHEEVAMRQMDAAASASVGPHCPAKRAMRQGFFGMTCTSCGMLFEDETEAEDHLAGPECTEAG